jgi:protein phosphatase
MVSAFGVSHPGTVRQRNEDRFLVDMEHSLFVIADGMGGHAAGEVASQSAVDTIVDFIQRTPSSSEASWPLALDDALSFDGNRLKAAVHLANRQILRLAEQRDDYVGMGSTVVGALIRGNRLAMAHAGDSRLYLWSGGVFSAQTRDDTWAASLLPDDAAAGGNAIAVHPMKHVLTNALGIGEQADIHLSERRLNDGDMLLLCSDGVHNVLDDASLAGMMSTGAPVDVIANEIVAAALQRGARDNVTALVVRYATDESDG